MKLPRLSYSVEFVNTLKEVWIKTVTDCLREIATDLNLSVVYDAEQRRLYAHDGKGKVWESSNITLLKEVELHLYEARKQLNWELSNVGFEPDPFVMPSQEMIDRASSGPIKMTRVKGDDKPLRVTRITP